MLQPQISPCKDIGQQRCRPSPTPFYKSTSNEYRPIFEYGIVSTITVSEFASTKYKESRTLLLG